MKHLFTKEEKRRFSFDGTVASVHAHLREFFAITQRKSRKRKISDKQFRLATVTAMVETAIVLARFDYTQEQTMELLSEIINRESDFETKSGWSNGKLIDLI